MNVRYRVDVRRFPPQDPASDYRLPDEVRREALIGLPPTDGIADQVSDLLIRLRQLRDVRGNLTRERLRADLHDLSRTLDRCLERDMLAVDRPDGCWCLGLGGRNPRWIPFVDKSGKPAYLRTFGTYCDCPDGQEAKAVAERMGHL